MSENLNSPAEQGQGSPGGEASGGFLASIADIFVDPMKVFRRIDGGLSWWKAYILIAVISIIIGIVGMPIQKQNAMLRIQDLSEEQYEQAVTTIEKTAFIQPISAPILIIIVLVIYGGIIHLFINLFSSRSSFKKTLSLVAFCGFIGLLEQIINVVVVRLKGVENIESVADSKISLSLAALFPEMEGFWFAFLESLGVFQVWYYILLVLGLSSIFKIDYKKALVPVVIIWLISLLLFYLGTKFAGGVG